MKHLFKSLALILFAVTLTTSVSAQKDVKSEIMEANERFMNLFAAGDAAAFVKGMYTKDAILMPPNAPQVTGMDNMIEMWGGMMQAGITPKVMTATAEAYGKTAIETGVVEIYAGDDKVDAVKYMVVWKKEKGEWMMHKDIWNSSMPAN